MWLCKLHYEGSHGQNVIYTKTVLTGGKVFHKKKGKYLEEILNLIN